MSEYIYRSNGEPLANERGEISLARAGEIVRCRDCVYMFDWAYDRTLCKLWAFNDQDESESGNGNTLYPKVEPDGFCKWGERREDD